MEWQPIETAPKDGTHILCGTWYADEDGTYFLQWVNWFSETWQWNGGGYQNPTHWMPLPAPPAGKDA